MTMVLLLEVLLFSGIFFVSQKSFLFSQKNVQSRYPAAETLLFSQFFHQEETLLFPIVSIRLQQFLIYRIRTSRLLVYMECSIHSRLTDLPLHGTHTGQIVLCMLSALQNLLLFHEAFPHLRALIFLLRHLKKLILFFRESNNTTFR